jgi:hypothetical protein
MNSGRFEFLLIAKQAERAIGVEPMARSFSVRQAPRKRSLIVT